MSSSHFYTINIEFKLEMVRCRPIFDGRVYSLRTECSIRISPVYEPAISTEIVKYIFRSEHIASVLSVTCALNNKLVVSGGEDSRIIITSLSNGQVANKIDHHRGPVTQVLFTSIGDVLVSSKYLYIVSPFSVSLALLSLLPTYAFFSSAFWL